MAEVSLSSNQSLTERTKQIRRHLVEMMHYSRSSHIGACLSIVDVLAVLYFKILKVDPRQPQNPTRDKFILSKAHASAALYATLAEAGFFELEALKKYYIDGGILPGHLDRTAVPGIETSGGSLGHGLSLGVGMALANQMDQNPGRVFVLLGDGECNEGSVWEAIMLGGHLKPSNLTAIVDYNKIQSLGDTNAIIDQRNMLERWRNFGWQAEELDGHDLKALEASLSRPSNAARVLILHTTKGKGISFMENKLAWHYKSPNDAERVQALKELE